MTNQISFTAFIDSKTIADECIANPALFSEILHFIAASDDADLLPMIHEAASEAIEVYDASLISGVMRMMAFKLAALMGDIPTNVADDELSCVRPAIPAEKGIPIPSENKEG